MANKDKKPEREPWEERFDKPRPAWWQEANRRRRRRWKKKHRLEGTDDEEELTEEDLSAKAIITGTLAMFGLESLAEWAWQMYLDGAPIEQIMIELRQRPEYKARFPAMEALSALGRALSEAEYIELERAYSEISHMYGLPANFYDDPNDFARLITAEVSPTEYEDRLTIYQQAAYLAPVEVRAELFRLFNVDEGGLIAYYIDPDRALPLLQRDFLASQSAGAAQITGFGALTVQEATALAQLGIDFGGATEGFRNLTRLSQLFLSLDPGEAEIDRQTQLGATFGGVGGDIRAIEQRTRRRLAPYEAGYGYVGSEQGFGGIGSASVR